MIIYHHRNDVFHCMFRFLSIISLLNGRKVELDRIKMIDFYFSFPHLLATTTIPRVLGSSKIKKEAKKLPLPYESLPSNKILFSEMGDFQSQALDILRSKGVLEIDSEGWIKPTEVFYTKKINDLLYNNRFTTKEFFKNIVEVFIKCTLYGPNGLKSKTGLMEYRYDAV